MLTKQEWIGSIIMGLISLYFARKKRKNPLVWFTIGFMFKLTGLCFLLLFPIIKNFFRKKKPPAEIATPKPASPVFPSQTIWYYLDEENKQNGPMSFQKLQEIEKNGIIHFDTYVWNETFNEWKKWKELF